MRKGGARGLLLTLAALAFGGSHALTGYNASAPLPHRLRGATVDAIGLCMDSSPRVQCEADGRTIRKGSIVDELHKELAARAGVTFNIRYGLDQPSQANRDKYGSPWTACAADVGAGLTDYCVSDFWETAQRRQYTGFVTPYDTDVFRLFIRTATPGPDLFAAAFKPFTTGLWAVIAALLAFHAIISFLLGSIHKRTVILHKILHKTKRRDKPKQKPVGQQLKKEAKRLGEELFNSTIGFVGGGPVTDNCDDVSTRVLSVGYGFFILVVLASYTANLAAFLTVQAQSTGFSNVDEAIAKRAPLCVGNGMLPSFGSMFPNGIFLGFDVMPFVALEEDTAQCEAIIDTPFKLASFQSTGQACDVTGVGNAIITVPIATPARREVDETLSYHMAVMRNDGIMAQILQDGVPKVQCSSEIDLDGQQLQIDNMASVLIVYSFFVGVALLIGLTNLFYTWHLTRSATLNPHVEPHVERHVEPPYVDMNQHGADERESPMMSQNKGLLPASPESPYLHKTGHIGGAGEQQQLVSLVWDLQRQVGDMHKAINQLSDQLAVQTERNRAPPSSVGAAAMPVGPEPHPLAPLNAFTMAGPSPQPLSQVTATSGSQVAMMTDAETECVC